MIFEESFLVINTHGCHRLGLFTMENEIVMYLSTLNKSLLTNLEFYETGIKGSKTPLDTSSFSHEYECNINTDKARK